MGLTRGSCVHGIQRMGFSWKLLGSFWGRGKSSEDGMLKEAPLDPEDTVHHGVPVGRMTYGYRSLSANSWAALNRIGRFCSIARGCSVVGASHPTEWVTTNPILYNVERGFITKRVAPPASVKMRNQKVTVGHDVWIGEGARIMRSVTLGHGCVVGAGSVVTKSVPPYAIVAGVPAKIIRYRIPEALIPDMLAIAWWDWPLKTIKSRVSAFYDPAEFVKTFRPPSDSRSPTL